MLALAFLVVSAALVAVAVTELEAEIVAGAVYNPVEEIVPTAGLRLQVTAVLVVPEMLDTNC